MSTGLGHLIASASGPLCIGVVARATHSNGEDGFDGFRR